jgi:hypothetical protein
MSHALEQRVVDHPCVPGFPRGRREPVLGCRPRRAPGEDRLARPPPCSSPASGSAVRSRCSCCVSPNRLAARRRRRTSAAKRRCPSRLERSVELECLLGPDPSVATSPFVRAMSAAPARALARQPSGRVAAKRALGRRRPSTRCPLRSQNRQSAAASRSARCCRRGPNQSKAARRLAWSRSSRSNHSAWLPVRSGWLRLLDQREEIVGVASAPPRDLPEVSRRSSAYSRIVSSIESRGSPSVPSRRINPLSSTTQGRPRSRDRRRRPLSAASIVHPPTNTARRTNERCSVGSRRSSSRSIVARSVRWRFGHQAPLHDEFQPVIEPLPQGRRRENADARLAASSIATAAARRALCRCPRPLPRSRA